MQLVIAEKPSVANTIAKSLGVADHKNGYIEGDNIIVSWCIGHLVELASADVYDERYKKWDKYKNLIKYKTGISIPKKKCLNIYVSL